MTITPFGNNILVSPIEKKQVLVAEQGTLCEYGTVIAIGDEVSKVAVGDTIGYVIFGVNRLTIDDQKYFFIPETPEFLLGKITM